MGQFAYESVLSVDYPSIIGVALLIALNYMVINTVVDILYGVIDPRVRRANKSTGSIFLIHAVKRFHQAAGWILNL